MKRTSFYSVALALGTWAGCWPTVRAWANLSESAFAADSTMPFGGTTADALWPSMAKLGGTLVVVLVLIWGSLWVAKRLMRRGGVGGRSSMRIIERMHLAPKRSVEVVSVGRRVLVLGVTDTTIALLTELTPDDLPDEDPGPLSMADRARAAGSRERDLLKQGRQRLQDLFRRARAETTDEAVSA